MGAHALLLKARTSPTEGPTITALGWPESAGLDPGCATSDLPLKPVGGSARAISPAHPKQDKEGSGFFADSQALRMCLLPAGVEFGPEWGAVVIFDSSLGLQILFPFFPTESWENRRWLVAYLHFVIFLWAGLLFLFSVLPMETRK